PFVVITTRTKLKRRSRRHAYNCEDGKIKQCCKQSLYVDFSLLGWDDWIIYPKGYTANYCMGECVQLHRSPDVMAYFHSHVIEEYRMKNPYASITPCCAPTKLSSISLIYFDPEGHIIKSDLPKMVVDECGCT
ncbi:PREDICTED: inhibin beta chain-like, partial [Rhagoletis zephyria]|uniref:inhibin beta chain-like n=1 Tax=Rhagoletis zephyria TaxID=28612 RepID=UPI000811590C